jgi:hypothetical protein
MAIYLLDTSVLVDAMNGRRNRREAQGGFDMTGRVKAKPFHSPMQR